MCRSDILTRRDLAVPSRRAAWLAVAGGAFFGFDLLFFNTSVLRTSATTAVLLGNNAPVFVGSAPGCSSTSGRARPSGGDWRWP